MEPPFPAMDPYLEAPLLWPDVHSSLALAIREQIQPALSPRYAAVITPYVTFETIELAPLRAVVPTRYARIEIRTVGTETLVTVIELLSPVNKRPGSDRVDAYERKRRELFRSEAHLLEIDLLRNGRRPALLTPLPDAPYFIFLSRAEHRPQIEIWPLLLQEPFPVVPVPLRYPDPDVPLDLTLALRRSYVSARYDLRIDYDQAPPLPPLSAEDNTWLDAHLRGQSLRG